MDVNSSDLEFFDFENASEEEIREIRAILKGPGSNGSVELPWENALSVNCSDSLSKDEKKEAVEKTNPSISDKNIKNVGSVVGPALHFSAQDTLSTTPVARPPNVEAFIAPPTSIAPYPPYIVSRTIPYLRAYHHMGMPIFACPIPGTAGDASTLPSPYGQFVPMVPATVAQEKLVGPVDPEPNLKNTSVEKQLSQHSKKKFSSDYSSSFESSEIVSDEAALDEGLVSVSSPMSSTASSTRPTSVPLVPLPVSPSTFGVAGGTIPLHGYPPGLHSLPYTQMTGPQAHSAAMYYVPVFNNLYSNYLPSPPAAPMVLNLQPETELPPVVSSSSSALAKTSEIVNCEQTSDVREAKHVLDSAAKNTSEGEDFTDCNSSSDYPMSKSSSPDLVPDQGLSDDFYSSPVQESGGKRCWADLFKKPHPEVNGIDRRLAAAQHRDKDELYTNGKVYVSTSDVS